MGQLVSRSSRWVRRDLLSAPLLLPLAACAGGAYPGTTWQDAAPARVGLDAAGLDRAVAHARSFGGSGIVVRGGYRVAHWGDQATRYPLYSATKSFGSILLGLAVADGRLRLGDPVQTRLPELGVPPASNLATGWLPLITARQLATQTAGFEKAGGFGALLSEPGTSWSYSDGGPNWLADLLTVTYAQDLDTVLRGRVLEHLQVSATDLTWRVNRYRPAGLRGIGRREFGSGIDATVGAMARVGLMMARGGLWRGRRILPRGYVRAAGATPPEIRGLPPRDPARWPSAPRRYGLLWWNNADGIIPGLPRDAFWAWGLNDQLLLVVPSLDLVAARAGSLGRDPPLGGGGFGDTEALRSYLDPLGRSVTR